MTAAVTATQPTKTMATLEREIFSLFFMMLLPCEGYITSWCLAIIGDTSIRLKLKVNIRINKFIAIDTISVS